MAVRMRGSRKVDTCTFDMPPELAKKLDSDVEERNKEIQWPPYASRNSVLVEVLSDHYDHIPEGVSEAQKN